jgi:Family of unknown function (DUF5906)/Primase C terminal 2 (PriCT-2)
VTEDALNTGIVCDGLCVIDFDVDDPVVAGKVFKIAEKHLPRGALIRGRVDSPRCAFVYRPTGWVPKKTAIGTEKGNKVEILGHGQFLVAHGVHEDGAKYDWQGADGPDTVPRDELAPVAEEVITEFLAEVAPELQAKVTLPGLGGQADGLLSNTTGVPFISAKFASFPLDNALGVGIESNKWFDKLRPADMSAVIKACLDAIDNRTSDPYDGWRNTPWAVADAGRLGCPDARQLARDWSRRGKAWTTEAAFDTTWNWYKAKGDGINVGSLIKQAYAAGVDLSPWRSSGSNVIQLPAAAAPTQTSAANDNSPVPAVAGSRMPLKGGTYAPAAALALFNAHFFIAMVEGAVPIAQIKDDGIISYLAPNDFNLLVDNITVQVADGKVMGGAQFWRKHPQRHQRKVVFRPRGTVASDEYNLWQGFAVTPTKGYGKQRRLLRHIWRIICRRDKAKFKYLMMWLAWCCQNPGERAETVIALMSRIQGAGKDTLSAVVRRFFGTHGVLVNNTRDLLGQFNAGLQNTAWVSGEELLWSRNMVGNEALKSLITGDTITLEVKNGARWKEPNRLKIMMTTNSAHAVQAGVGDRRFYVLDVDDEMAQQRSWFDPMRKDLDEGGDGQFLWLLLNLQLKDFHPRHRPKTAELIDQQYRSADSVSQWASTCIEADGIATAVPYPTTLPLSQTIETASLLSSYTDFCRRQGQRCVDERSFGKALATMFGKDARARLPAQGSGGRRPWGYAVPDAEAWRQALDQYLGI